MEQKKLRVGVFGTWRGIAHIRSIQVLDEAEVVSICDKDPDKIEKAKKYCAEDVLVCETYEELLDSGIDLVVLCNYLPDHTACAIRALRKGIAVVTECLAAATMKECVELVEAVEETGVYFSMAENSPYRNACIEMERIFKSGVLGEVMYGEGEYCHPGAPADAKVHTPDDTHWRVRIPRTYYLTHSLAPLMNITGLMPKRVIGKVVPGRAYAKRRNSSKADAAAMMLVEMENGVLFRVTGSSCLSPKTHWYRLACEKGGVENARTDERAVSLSINAWDLPEEMTSQGCTSFYVPRDDAATREAIKRGLPDMGHLLTDFRCVRNYINEILEGRYPDMDVYRSVAMSAVGILGWRSVLDDSKQYDIPDFRDPAARDAFRDDDLDPWSGKIPYRVFEA